VFAAGAVLACCCALRSLSQDARVCKDMSCDVSPSTVCMDLQVLQWVFAGAPGHPALRDICDHIARHATTVFSNNTNRDTLERTGPGVWTDVILRHALQHPPAKASISRSAAAGLKTAT
jgi:hypothetical protein